MNENSALFWLDKVSNLEIPMPRTIFCAKDVESAQTYAQSIGYPVFVRTDLCSGKHDWERSCFVKNAAAMATNLPIILQADVRWNMLGIYSEALMIREFLDLETSFTAFDGNMPINKERRYFIADGLVQCKHPYWPESAFNRHPARMAHDPAWQEKLAVLNAPDPSEFVLQIYAEQVSKVLPGSWSVDFAKGKDGRWYLLDMALAYNSFHMAHSPNVRPA